MIWENNSGDCEKANQLTHSMLLCCRLDNHQGSSHLGMWTNSTPTPPSEESWKLLTSPDAAVWGQPLLHHLHCHQCLQPMTPHSLRVQRWVQEQITDHRVAKQHHWLLEWPHRHIKDDLLKCWRMLLTNPVRARILERARCREIQGPEFMSVQAQANTTSTTDLCFHLRTLHSLRVQCQHGEHFSEFRGSKQHRRLPGWSRCRIKDNLLKCWHMLLINPVRVRILERTRSREIQGPGFRGKPNLDWSRKRLLPKWENQTLEDFELIVKCAKTRNWLKATIRSKRQCFVFFEVF